MSIANNWLYWALLSAVFAALTTILAKIGLDSIDSDYATLIRTFVIIIILSVFIFLSGKWINPAKISHKSLLFLIFSGLATSASWLCYFRALKIGQASKVAPVDKTSLVLVAIFAVMFLHEKLLVKDWLGILLISIGVIVLGLNK